ncbi:efflux RND transporter periplasmic adaptor subunit [Mucilaginibacter robiniae]|uniref:Efflux RND transporter periplasmic adaptor subunit n=1 Tax=Mucilaginibacter robiniae TaxID=2728022 RepID=A0A7L5E3Z5_9SPHI|nr:efflux RND transporter periplasmic adaptor subunit [Mucilaginibacter robiniae]QJD97815.1 efflux RND transporter periplasmic adaptor subunit [Mucilaginibacter robiniae]
MIKLKYTFWAAPLLALTWTACKHQDKNASAAPPPTSVSVATAEAASAIYYNQYQATVVALNSVELRAQVAGFITGIFFKEGEVVPKGKLLYEIDRRKYEAAYQQARANLSSAQANLVKAQKDADRYTFLLRQDAVARQTYDQSVAALATARSQVDVARAGVTSALTDLSYSVIKAPFTGRIGISQVKLGAEVSIGSTLLNTISSENPMGVDIVVNEQDINRYYKLQRHSTDSTFRLQLSDGIMYKQRGKIFAIDRGVNNQTGTIKVRVEFSNPRDSLKDGMSGVLNVLNNESGSRIQIPYKAVSEQMGEFFVFVAQDTIAHQIKVKLGPRINDKVVVMSGLNAGEKVITDGFQRLREGGRITLGPPPAAQQSAGGKQGRQDNVQQSSGSSQSAEKPNQNQQQSK